MTREAIRRRHHLRHILRDVAGLAVEIAVRTGQRVFCPGVVLKAPLLPIKGIMAEAAIRPEAPFVMLVAVTFHTFQRGLLEFRRTMTRFAANVRMAADQWKSRDIVIDRYRLMPRDLGVTIFAFDAELSFVPIVLPVARYARGRQLVAIKIAAVAGVALDLRMGAFQSVFGVLVVVEANHLPLVFGVAVSATWSVAPHVYILDHVTAHALRPDPLVLLSTVTGETRHGAMGIPE